MMTQPSNGSTQYLEFRCISCMARLGNFYSIGDGTIFEVKCYSCNAYNLVEKTDEGVIRLFRDIKHVWSPSVNVPVSG